MLIEHAREFVIAIGEASQDEGFPFGRVRDAGIPGIDGFQARLP